MKTQWRCATYMVHNIVHAHTKQEEIIKPPSVLTQRADKCLLIIMDVL